MKREKYQSKFFNLCLVLLTSAVVAFCLYVILLLREVPRAWFWEQGLIFWAGYPFLAIAVFLFLLFLSRLHWIYGEDIGRKNVGRWIAGAGLAIGLVATGLDSGSMTAERHAFFIFGIGVAVIGIVLFWPIVRRIG